MALYHTPSMSWDGQQSLYPCWGPILFVLELVAVTQAVPERFSPAMHDGLPHPNEMFSVAA